MRQKVAKALRREARKFAERTGRTTDTYKTIGRKKKITIRDTALNPDGTYRDRVIEVTRTQDLLADGPRFFYQQLKKAHRRGLLTRTAAA